MAKGDQKSISGVWLKASGVPGIPQVDYDRYLAEIETCEYNDEEAAQLIEALHAIASGFADIAWSISSTHTACGKGDKKHIELPKSATDMLKSSVKSKQKPTHKNGSGEPFTRSHR